MQQQRGQKSLISAGVFRSVRLLHEGDYSDVYEGVDTSDGGKVALKVLGLARKNADIARSMYMREVAALTQLEHEGIVRILGHSTSDAEDQLVIALEFIPNPMSLHDFILTRGATTSLQWRVKQILKLVDAIRACHKQLIIHRDISLDNVLVADDYGEYDVKLTDFGIAKIIEGYRSVARGPQQDKPLPTLHNFYALPFSAPEQRNFRKSSFSSDVYAFGLLAASMLMMKVPKAEFQQSDIASFLDGLHHLLPNQALTSSLSVLLERSLAVEEAHRPTLDTIHHAFERLDEKLTRKVEVGLAFHSKVLDKLRKQRYTATDVLRDLNTRATALYSDEEGRESLRLFSGRFEARVVRARDQERVPLVIDIRHIQTTRPRALHPAEVTAFVQFQQGQSGADELFDEPFQAFEAERRKDRLQAERFLFCETPQRVLDFYESELKPIEFTYELKGKGKGGKALDVNPHTPIELKVVRVRRKNSGDEISFDEVRDDLKKGLSVEITDKGRATVFARIEHVGKSDPFLKLIATRACKLPSAGTVQTVDVASKANIHRQRQALDAFAARQTKNPLLDHVLLEPGQLRPTAKQVIELFDRRLTSTESVIESMLASNGLYLLQGPPGTGKTTHIVELARQIVKRKPDAKVLITSQANIAVNNAVENLYALSHEGGTNLRIVRDVSKSRQDKGTDEFSEAYSGWAGQVRERSEAYEAGHRDELPQPDAEKVRRTLAVWREALAKDATVRTSFRRSAQVYGATLLRVPALSRELAVDEFDWVIIDEAAKANDSELLVPMIMGKKIVLIGDHKQLPPFVTPALRRYLEGAGVARRDYDHTLFERLYKDITPACRAMLQTNYRMHSSIASMIGSLYYDGALYTPPEVDRHRDVVIEELKGDNRIFWRDLEGMESFKDGSAYNPAEVAAIFEALSAYEDELRSAGVVYSIGVITPYREQRVQLTQRIRPDSSRWRQLRVQVATTHDFQGKDSDLTLYSLVRTDARKMRFVEDERLLNVAFSRARYALLIFGSVAAARANPNLKKVVTHIPDANQRSL